MAQTTQDLLERLEGLSTDEIAKLGRVARAMPIVADISRSDLMLYARHPEHGAILVAQARPHSIMPVYAADLLGRTASPRRDVALLRAMRWGRRVRGSRRLIAGGAPVIQEVWPVRSPEGRIVGALNVEANLIAYVRQQSRSKVFQRAVRMVQRMLLLDELKGAESLSPFSQHDGVLVVDSHRVTRYASGIATDHYRRLGHLDSLVDRHLSTLDTGDWAMFRQVYERSCCLEEEMAERPHLTGAPERIWVRKGVPLIAHRVGEPWWRPLRWPGRGPVGVLFMIHDATEERQQERKLKVQSAMLQEIHHRVKNNLQTIAALLRMQIRRAKSSEVRQVLGDSVNRIMSVAVVHEYLSREEGRAINVREVTQRIVQQTTEAALSPDKRIRIVLEQGNSLSLPARQATACALVINELIQNALEHAYAQQSTGTIRVELIDEGDVVRIVVADDGEGLPDDFDLEATTSLGLQIVRTLVQDDLGGTLEITSNGGTEAVVRFSKRLLEGEEHWNALG
ncbi:MAG: histidine kinase N-terminal domain-containing protein [Anaerolineae bacterium]|nr:histidine kinase N-terminal domain-containing protein [Anaerolineae bacterium]